MSLHTAARSSTIDLSLLDKRDFAPVGYQRYNKSTGKVVNWNDVVKGYEYEKGEYVVLTDEDFRRANVEASRTIDIQTFVARDAIAPYYFDTPYFLVPDKGGERVYALLRDALEQSSKLAVATFVLRSKQHVAALMPVDKSIVLNTLRYEEEIQPHPDVAAAVAKKVNGSSGRELDMALKLVDEMTEKWNPEVFKNTYRNDLMKRIEAEGEGGPDARAHRARSRGHRTTRRRRQGRRSHVPAAAQPRAARQGWRQRCRRARQQTQTQRGAPAHQQPARRASRLMHGRRGQSPRE